MKKYCWLIIIFFLLTPFFYASAQTAFHLAPECGYADKPACTVCDIVNLAITYAKIILGAISSASLLMVVIGGLIWITSAGNQERIAKGRKVITAAVIGVLIVAFAWVGVNAVIGILNGSLLTSTNSDININGVWTPWAQGPICQTTIISNCKDTGVKVGTRCGNSDPCNGDTSCFCQISQGDFAALEAAGDCNGKCICMSLCDKIVRDYPGAYDNYACIDISRISEKNYGSSSIAKCLTGDMCPHEAGGEIKQKCCDQTGF